MDKKTIGLMLALGLMVGFFWFISQTVDMTQYFNFTGNYTLDTPASTVSGRKSFSDILETPTPVPSITLIP